MRRSSEVRWSVAWTAVCLIAIPVGAYASNVTIDSATAFPGFGACSVPVYLDVASGEQVAGAQWDLVFDSDLVVVDSVETGPAASDAGKSVSSSNIEPGRLRVLVTGLNMNVMSSGVIAVVTLSVLDGSPAGVQPLDLEDAMLADPYGASVACVTTPGALTIDDAALSAGWNTAARQSLACCVFLGLGLLYLGRQGRTRWLRRY